jgi:hypothetical protein
MNNQLNINVSGGGAAIGAVNQGDRGNVHGSASVTQQTIESNFSVAARVIDTLAREFRKNQEETQAAIAQLTALKKEVEGNKDTGKANSILKIVRDNFAWAYPAIKEFVKAVWPVLLSAVGL